MPSNCLMLVALRGPTGEGVFPVPDSLPRNRADVRRLSDKLEKQRHDPGVLIPSVLRDAALLFGLIAGVEFRQRLAGRGLLFPHGRVGRHDYRIGGRAGEVALVPFERSL
jgi:hypothetical protein